MTPRKPKLAKAAAGSAADAFARRWVRRGHFDVVTADPSAALAALETARSGLERGTGLSESDPARAAAVEAGVAAVDAALADLDECKVRIWFQQPVNVAGVAEKIRTRYPLPDELKAPGADWTAWKFWPAVAAAFAAEAGDTSLTEAQWIEQVAGWSEAERAELITVLAPILSKTPSADLPKD